MSATAFFMERFDKKGPVMYYILALGVPDWAEIKP